MRLPRSETSRSLRLRQGVILLVGAIVIVLTVGPSPTGFYWTPLAVAFEARLHSVLGDTRFYALLIGAVGLVNLLMGAFGREDVLSSPGDPVAP